MFIVLACLLAVPIDKLLNRLQRLLYRQYVARTRLTSMKHVLILASTMETAHKSSKWTEDGDYQTINHTLEI